MKVKNIAFSGFMASILMAGAAYAADTPTLATDQYVIQGVNYAISQAQGYTNDVIGSLPENTTVTGYIESAVSAAEAALDQKQKKIDSANKLSADFVSGLATVATTGAAADITDDATHRFVTDTEKSAWNAKQDALPATSGKSGMVLKVGESGLEWAADANSQYDDTVLAGRVKALEDTGVTVDKISAIASNTAAIASNASAIAEKQTQLNATQLAAVNSGIDATKVGKYDAYNTTLTELAADITELDNKKQATIDADNKLSASLVSGLAAVATSGKASDLNNDLNFQSADDVTAAIALEISDHDEAPDAHADIREDISGLQDAISDLDTIRSGAALGATAVQQAALNTALDGKQDTIDSTHKLSASLVDGLGTMAAENAADYTKTVDLGDLATKDTITSADITGDIATSKIATTDSAQFISATDKAQIGTNAAAIEDIVDGTTKVAKATSADSATNATNATKATQDASGNVITDTYATKTELSALTCDDNKYCLIVGNTAVPYDLAITNENW